MLSDKEINKIIESFSMIVCGYAFMWMEDGNIRITGLNKPNHALVICPNGEVLETNMDDVEGKLQSLFLPSKIQNLLLPQLKKQKEMATSSKEIEVFWNRYSTEGVKKGIVYVGACQSDNEGLLRSVRQSQE